MSNIVDKAFNKFIQEEVDLDKDVVAKARDSKENLLLNISEFSNKDNFFNLYSAINIQFGSFAKRTKCRPLDDIDLMIGVAANGATYYENSTWNNIIIKSNPDISTQIDCSEYDSNLKFYKLNSTKVLNKFKAELSKLPEYQHSKLSKNSEAITLNLVSKEWSFDIVPCFITEPDYNGRSYYLIPNGNGKWKKTDPRIDKNRILKLTNKYGEIMLKVLRLFKYWNNYAQMVTLEGYVAECLLLQYFEEKSNVQLNIKILFKDILQYVKEYIDLYIKDPKEIQGNLNNLSTVDKFSIKGKINTRINIINQALNEENKGNYCKAICLWRDIFGDKFPKYQEK